MLQPESVKKKKHSDLFELCYWSQLSPALQRSSVYVSVSPEAALLGLVSPETVEHRRYLWVLAVCVSSGNPELLDM